MTLTFLQNLILLITVGGVGLLMSYLLMRHAQKTIKEEKKDDEI